MGIEFEVNMGGLKGASPEEMAEDLVNAYVKSMPPVIWVDWLYRLAGDADEEVLSGILFTGESLNDLTTDAIRKQIINFAINCVPLRKIILEDILLHIDD